MYKIFILRGVRNAGDIWTPFMISNPNVIGSNNNESLIEFSTDDINVLKHYLTELLEKYGKQEIRVVKDVSFMIDIVYKD